MDTVEILVQGYATINKDHSWKATCNTSLIKSNGKIIVFDPGCDRKLLLGALKKKGIKPEGVNWVFISHRHLDHSALLGLFPKAKVIDDELFQNGPHGKIHNGKIPETKVKIIKTPGHAPRHASLLVSTKEGVVAVAGDVFWWAKGVKPSLDINQKDDFADGNYKDLVKSRKLLLAKADWIIPGHGPKTKVIRKHT